MAMGDSNGLSASFMVLQFFVTILCYFIWYYIYCWMNFVYYYVYGSIEAKEKAKRILSLLLQTITALWPWTST